MELRHLQYFVTVAETGGFGRAARTLHVSQSAISEQIRDLEAEIGVMLFDRGQRQIRLTVEGELFLEGARETLHTASEAVEKVRRAKRGEEGRLTIGFFVGGNGRYFPALIRAFRKRYPRVKVALVEMTPTQQWQALGNAVIDFGFTRPNMGSLVEGVKTEILFKERLYVAMLKDHKLADRKEIPIALLRDERFVLSERVTSSSLYDRVLKLCAQAGYSPNIGATASVSSGVLSLVEAGEGISVVAAGSRFLALNELSFVPLQGAEAYVDLVMAWPIRRTSGPLKAFLELARTFRNAT
ncbi:LysR substrate-binding domain-containing protein [Granulicella cerasi]|uniref:LysR substrate-binding domain-containing protein n=1 Tax=Granulicella cerasi TaxID=741063 RepID=A0ABW1Z5X2_9BACT|nr:LysR substrate-binding domain-containing protein [Granulicella cerasi]